MVQLRQNSIAQEAMDINLAKEGYTAYYVDGTDGLDTYPGDSWDQPFKTVQHAIDEASSWAKIFVKDGTYNENVVVAKDHIHLIGNDKETTILTATTGFPVIVSGHDCEIEDFYGKAVELGKPCFSIGGEYNSIHDCMVYGSNVGLSVGVAITGAHSKAYNITNVADTYMGVYSSGNYNEIYGCHIDAAYTGVQVVGDQCEVHNNEFRNGKAGGWAIDIDGDNNSIYHNNLVSNNKYTSDVGSGNRWFENYYSDHTTDTNNDGMADTSRTEDGATDYQPVSHRNGWNQESLPVIVTGGDATAANQTTIISGQEGSINAVNRSAGNLQPTATTIDLNQAAATYTLFTGTTQAVKLKSLAIRTPNVSIAAGALTSISIQTDDVTPAVIISAADGAIGNLTEEANLPWTGDLLIPVGTLVQLTIAGGAGGTACVCDVVAESRAVVNGGYLA